MPPIRQPRLTRAEDPGSGAPGSGPGRSGPRTNPCNASQPFMSVAEAKMVVAFENTQPLIVPANEPAVPWEIVTLPPVDPARMLPSKLIATLGLIVALPPTIQKMLSGFAPFIRLKVIVPLKARFPGAWMMKTALTLCWALNVKVMPEVDEVFVGKLYNVLPKRVWLVDRPLSAVAPVRSMAVLHACSKSAYALVAAAGTDGDVG